MDSLSLCGRELKLNVERLRSVSNASENSARDLLLELNARDAKTHEVASELSALRKEGELLAHRLLDMKRELIEARRYDRFFPAVEVRGTARSLITVFFVETGVDQVYPFRRQRRAAGDR